MIPLIVVSFIDRTKRMSSPQTSQILHQFMLTCHVCMSELMGPDIHAFSQPIQRMKKKCPMNWLTLYVVYNVIIYSENAILVIVWYFSQTQTVWGAENLTPTSESPFPGTTTLFSSHSVSWSSTTSLSSTGADSSDWLRVCALVVVLVGHWVGILFSILFYTVCHESKMEIVKDRVREGKQLLKVLRHRDPEQRKTVSIFVRNGAQISLSFVSVPLNQQECEEPSAAHHGLSFVSSVYQGQKSCVICLFLPVLSLKLVLIRCTNLSGSGWRPHSVGRTCHKAEQSRDRHEFLKKCSVRTVSYFEDEKEGKGYLRSLESPTKK